MSRTLFTYLSAIWLLLGTGGAACWGQVQGVVLWCGEMPVYGQELGLFMESLRAKAIRETLSQYDVNYGTDFWELPLENGRTPKDLLVSYALDALLPYKVQQRLMVEVDMMDDWQWSSFLNAYQAYSMRQSTSVAQGKVSYGPARLSLVQYYKHTFESRRYELINRLVAAGQLGPEPGAYQQLVNRLKREMQPIWTTSLSNIP